MRRRVLSWVLAVSLLAALFTEVPSVAEEEPVLSAPVDEIVEEADETEIWTEEIAEDVANAERELAALEAEENASKIPISKKYFPDAKFREYVKASLDTNHDGYLQKAEAYAVTEIDVTGMGIKKLTGIGKFPNLLNLYCGYNKLTTLNVKNNKKLEILYCGNNTLKKLDVAKNAKLIELYCFDNQLTTLNVTKNTKLTELHCDGNRLKKLNVAQNKKLKYLSCHSNKITSLDLRKNTKLEYLYCENNGVKTLKLGKNKKLFIATLYGNKLKSIDLSKCAILRELATWEPDWEPYGYENTVCFGDQGDWSGGFLHIDDTTKLKVNGTVVYPTAARVELKKYVGKASAVAYCSSLEEENDDIRNAYEGVFGKLTRVQWDDSNYKFDRVYLKGKNVRFYAFGSGGGYLLDANALYSLFGFYPGMTMKEAKQNASGRSDVTRFISSYGADIYEGLAEAQAVTNAETALGWAKVSVVLLYNKSTNIIERIGLEVFIGA